MAFDAAGMNCIGVGPQKLYIYTTTDTLTSTANQTTNWNTTDCPNLEAGDVIFVAHNTAALLDIVRITSINATSCTLNRIKELA